jgi:hypothetical protein
MVEPYHLIDAVPSLHRLNDQALLRRPRYLIKSPLMSFDGEKTSCETRERNSETRQTPSNGKDESATP